MYWGELMSSSEDIKPVVLFDVELYLAEGISKLASIKNFKFHKNLLEGFGGHSETFLG